MVSIKQFIKNEFEEYLQNGYCKKAYDMNQVIGEDYFDTVNPHFFTGNPESDIVLVMLNPKRDKNQYNAPNTFATFEEYWNHYENFGRNVYGIKSARKSKEKFDLNQLLFFRNLDVIDFIEEKTNSDKFDNLEKAIDQKLQWELVPYGSPNFNFKHIGTYNLKYFLDKAIEVISMHERKYVFFCGAVFRELIWFENIKCNKNHKFRLIKTNGTETRDYYEMISVELNNNNKKIKAAILPQYSRQGAPLETYAKKVKELY